MNKRTLLNGWNLPRWLRLGLGIIIAIQAVQMHDMLSGLFAGFFLFQAVTNTGCCGTSNCVVIPKKDDSKDIIFEEIKSK